MGDKRRGRAGAGPRRRGHSLTELLVVMAIILTLIALSLPYYMKAIRMAHGAVGTVQGEHHH